MYVIRVFTILIALNLADAFLENIIDEAIVSLQENIYGPVWAHICTGKSLSEALIFAEHGKNMLCTKIFKFQKQFLYTTCSPRVLAWNFHVLNL